MAVTTLQEVLQLLAGEFVRIILDYGLKVPLYTAHGSLELMGNILSQLLFEAALLFGNSNVVYNPLEAVTSEQNGTQGKDTPRDLYLVRNKLLALAVVNIPLIVYEAFDIAQFGLAQDILHLGKMHC